LFTPDELAHINAKVALVADDAAPFIAEDDQGASFNYGDGDQPKRLLKLRAAEWFGVEPGPGMTHEQEMEMYATYLAEHKAKNKE